MPVQVDARRLADRGCDQRHLHQGGPTISDPVVFELDIEQCPRCGGTLKIIAAIEDPT
jgi:hypothetical protein